MRESDRIETLRPYGSEREGVPRSRRGSALEADLEAGPPAHAPRGVGELLDLAFEVLRARFTTFAAIGFLLWLPVRVVQLILSPGAIDPPETLEAGISFLLGIAAGAGAATIVHSLCGAVMALVVYAVLCGERLSAGGAFRIALRRLLGILWIAFLTGAIGVVGMMMCFFPFVYFSWKLALAQSVYVLERESVSQSIGRSFRLSEGSFLRWLGVVVVLFLVSAPLGGLNALFEHPVSRSQLIEDLALSPRW
jgi:hypothetical protein